MAETRKLTCSNCNAVVFTTRAKVAKCPSCGTAYGKDAESATFAQSLGEGVLPELAGDMAAARATIAADAAATVAPADAPASETVDGKPAARPRSSSRAK